MKLTSIGFTLLLLTALPLAADDAATAAEPFLAGTPAASCAEPTAAPVPTSAGDGFSAQSTCYAEAQCQWGTVSCSGETSCFAYDRNCSVEEPGHVVCDNVATYCSQSCCPCGSCGAIRWFKTEQCCAIDFHVMEERRCTTSGWVNTGKTDCLVECGGTKL